MNRLLALGVASLMVATGAIAVGQDTAEAADTVLPPVIPALQGWQPSATGAYTVGESPAIVVDASNPRLASTAEILQAELAALWGEAPEIRSETAPGDIEIRIDDSRSAQLREEGYELSIADTVTVTAATARGAFYGSRTVLQLLSQARQLPGGSVVDVPKYGERGVTICACVINVSTDWLDRLLEEMSFLKLNQLLLEMKLKVEGYPETNTWSYYTKADIRTLVAKAAKYNIDVIPEINSPGHMEIWLENLPGLQLTNPATGAKDEVRLDITQEAAFDFYTDLIDEYSEVFTSPYWHMGADEYMLGSGYSNYPQIAEFAVANWGTGATPNDVVAWYVNKVNAYVKSKGKTLRIWNDGVMVDTQKVDFDSDIIVEHWNQAGSSVLPQDFLTWGHRLMNASQSLYMVRGGYGVNTRYLYDSGWNAGNFSSQQVDRNNPLLTGAKMSVWPDNGTPSEAENTTESRMFEALRFVAQSTWAANRPWANYDAFLADMRTIGRPPLWENIQRAPLPAGSYAISTTGGGLRAEGASVTVGAPQQFTFNPTPDGYYTITDTAGRCLDVSRTGTVRLGVPVEIGVNAVLSACSATTIQRWQLKRVSGGFEIVNAASQQHLSISAGLVHVPVSHQPEKSVPDGRVVQTPKDWGATVWEIAGSASISVQLSGAAATPGTALTAAVVVRNGTLDTIQGARIEVSQVPTGWSAEPTDADIASVAPGAEVSSTFTLRNDSANFGTATFRFQLRLGDRVLAEAVASSTAQCTDASMRPTAVTSFSSQQTTGEPTGSGVATAAIDGNPLTYWHSQWSPTEPTHPHAIVVDLGAEATICGIRATPRTGTTTGAVNGRIADYEVYTSAVPLAWNATGWGAPVARGTWAAGTDVKLATFEPRTARYIKLVALSEVNQKPWATLAELAAIGPFTSPPSQVSVRAETRCVGDRVYVVGSASNEEGGAVAITISSPFGQRVFDNVASGKSAVVSQNTRQSAVPGGEVTFRITRLSDGAVTTRTAAYAALTCTRA